MRTVLFVRPQLRDRNRIDLFLRLACPVVRMVASDKLGVFLSGIVALDRLPVSLKAILNHKTEREGGNSFMKRRGSTRWLRLSLSLQFRDHLFDLTAAADVRVRRRRRRRGRHRCTRYVSFSPAPPTLNPTRPSPSRSSSSSATLAAGAE